MKSTSIGVIGGGMLGLTLAYRLSQQGYKVTVLESAPKFGGLTSTWKVGSLEWERYYHVTMLSDVNLRELLTELELEKDINWQVTKTHFYTGNAMYPLNNVVDYLRLPILGLIDKLRLGLNILYGSIIENGLPLQKISAEQWLTKISGRNTYKKLWRPLLRAKLGSNTSKASAAFIWSVIRRFYAARRGGMKTEMFGYVPGGYGVVLNSLVKKLEENNVETITSAKVSSILKDETGSLQVNCEVQAYQFDRVVNTCPGALVVKMCEGLGDQEKSLHAGLLYQGIVCASVVLKRPLAGAYLTYITDEKIPFTAVIEMTSLVDPESLGGQHLVYLPKYVPSDDRIFNLSDSEIEEQFITALLHMYPDLNQDDISAFRLSRTRHVVAVSTLNYSENLPPIITSVSGLYVLNSAQIANASLSVEETVSLANRGAELITQNEQRETSS